MRKCVQHCMTRPPTTWFMASLHSHPPSLAGWQGVCSVTATIQWLICHVQVMLNSFESEPVHETVCGVGIGKESLIYYVSVFL